MFKFFVKESSKSSADMSSETSQETFTALNASSPLWKERGKFVRGVEEGGKIFSLNNGVQRIEWSDGSKSIYGLKTNGVPVVHVKDMLNIWCQLDLPVITIQLQDDARAGAGESLGVIAKEYYWAYGNVQYCIYPRGHNGAQLIIIKFQDRGIFEIISEHTLSEKVIIKIIELISKVPPIFDRHLRNLFVLKSIGAINNKRTGRNKTAACASGKGNIIWITCDTLEDDSISIFAILHEIGHIIDYYWSKEVRSISKHTLTSGTKFFWRKKNFLEPAN